MRLPALTILAALSGSLAASLSAQTTIFSDSFGGSGAIEGQTADTNVGNASSTYVVVNGDGLNDNLWVESGGVLTWDDAGGTNLNTTNNRIYNDITLSGGTSYEYTAIVVPGAAGTVRVGLGRTTAYLSNAHGFAVAMFSGDAQFEYWNGTSDVDNGRVDLNWDRDDEIRVTITYDAVGQTVSASVENLTTPASASLASSITLSGWDPEADLQYVQNQFNNPTDGIASLSPASISSIEVTAIPEPSHLAAFLAAAALFMVAGVRRRVRH